MFNYLSDFLSLSKDDKQSTVGGEVHLGFFLSTFLRIKLLPKKKRKIKNYMLNL